MGVTTAIIGGAVIGGGLSYLASSNAADAQESAADTMAGASASASAQDWAMYQQNRKDMMPWLTQGTTAVNQLGALMAPGGQLYNTQFTPEMFKAGIDPAYAWDVNQGINALTAKSAAAGNYGSGNLGTALVDYGQNMASNEFQNAWNRWQQSQNTLYSRLAGLSGTGQAQSGAMANLGASTANAMGANMLTGASALGAGQVGAANTWSNAYNSIGNQLQSGVGMYMNNQNQLRLMDMLSQGMYGGAQYNPYSGAGANYGYGDWTGGLGF